LELRRGLDRQAPLPVIEVIDRDVREQLGGQLEGVPALPHRQLLPLGLERPQSRRTGPLTGCLRHQDRDFPGT
jgi:hypothetical protein